MTQDAVADSKQFSPATRLALANFLLALVDNKRFVGIRYAEWCDSGPTLEAAVAASAMAQDELGHARALLPLLREFPELPPELQGEDRAEYRHVAFLDQPLAGWPAFVAVNTLFDRALTLVFEAATASRYFPLQQRARKIVDEERFHRLHGEGWFRRLARAGAASHATLQDAVSHVWLETVCWYGTDEGDLHRLVGDGILSAEPGELRRRFLEHVEPILIETGIPVPNTAKLPWERWDPLARRLNRQHVG